MNDAISPDLSASHRKFHPGGHQPTNYFCRIFQPGFLTPPPSPPSPIKVSCPRERTGNTKINLAITGRRLIVADSKIQDAYQWDNKHQHKKREKRTDRGRKSCLSAAKRFPSLSEQRHLSSLSPSLSYPSLPHPLFPTPYIDPKPSNTTPQSCPAIPSGRQATRNFILLIVWKSGKATWAIHKCQKQLKQPKTNGKTTETVNLTRKKLTETVHVRPTALQPRRSRR